jgi:hypothetical protein
MTSLEVGATVVLLALTAGVASKAIQVPIPSTAVPVVCAILVLGAIAAFYTYPAIALIALLLAAVLMYDRNIHDTMRMVYRPSQTKEAIERRIVNPDEQTNWSSVPPTPQTGLYPLPSSPPVVGGLPSTNPPAAQNRGTYGEYTIMNEPHKAAHDAPTQGGGFLSEPRPYDEFNETDPKNKLLGPVKVTEGFATMGQTAGRPDIGAPEAYGADPNSPGGAYPINEPRALVGGTPVDFNYHPQPDMGSNTFVRSGPNLNVEKNEVFKYYT